MRLVPILFGLILSACVVLPIPMEHKVTPTYFGRVADAETGKPISGAIVTVRVDTELEKSREFLEAVTKTDIQGLYEISITREGWFVLLPPPSEGLCSGIVRVSHPGYDDTTFKTVKFTSALLNGPCTGLSLERDISLKRKQK